MNELADALLEMRDLILDEMVSDLPTNAPYLLDRAAKFVRTIDPDKEVKKEFLQISRERLRELIAKEGDSSVEVGSPDMFCVTQTDGECISTDPRCMHQVANEYAPWENEGITELEYFKRAYLDARRREPAEDFERVEADLLHADYGTTGVEIMVVLPEGTPMPDFTNGLSLNLKFTDIDDE